MYILNTWSQDKKHQFEVVGTLPEGAQRDNHIELDDEVFTIYAMPDIPAFGRSFAANLWTEYLMDHEDAFDDLWEKLHRE